VGQGEKLGFIQGLGFWLLKNFKILIGRFPLSLEKKGKAPRKGLRWGGLDSWLEKN